MILFLSILFFVLAQREEELGGEGLKEIGERGERGGERAAGVKGKRC